MAWWLPKNLTNDPIYRIKNIRRFQYLMEKEGVFEGKDHDASMISNLIPLVEMIAIELPDLREHEEYLKRCNIEDDYSDKYKEITKIIDNILDFNPPIDLFNHESYYPNFFAGASPKSLLRFFFNIEKSNGWIIFLKNFIRTFYFITKKFDKSEIKKLFKKILSVDPPLRIFEERAIHSNSYRNPEGLYLFYLYDHGFNS